MTLARLTSPEVPVRPLVLVPVGSVEQHGPHLPVDTDTVIADAVAHRIADRLGATVAPALNYGSSGEHQSFAGTCSLGTDALTHLLIELTRSLAFWAGRTVFVNGHGGNVAALRAAVEQLTAEGHDVDWVPCATEPPHISGEDLHAGRTETSLLLHLCPESVRCDRLEVGNTQPLHEILPAMMAGGVAAVSPNGVLGDPRGATAEEGERLLADIVDRATKAVQ